MNIYLQTSKIERDIELGSIANTDSNIAVTKQRIDEYNNDQSLTALQRDCLIEMAERDIACFKRKRRKIQKKYNIGG